ncbi:MAG: YetF domain-containing protein [Anditalea sp.]
MENIFFDNWQSIGRTFIITILAYVLMIVMLRVSGKRTLSKMNAFDFIVTIALGSSLATVALNKNVALADGVLAFFLLIFLQYFITWLSVRTKKVKRIVTSQPTLLLYKGEILNDILKKERITIEEVNVAARKKGISQLKDIDVVVLETTGDITVIPKLTTNDAETMKTVKNYP